MAKKKTAKSTAESSSTTVLSVRFSEEELERIKEAAAILEQPPASWVRQAALNSSIQTINASQTPTQQRAIAEISKQVAQHLFKGQVRISEIDHMDPSSEWTHRASSSYVDNIHGCLEVEALPMTERTRRNLVRALEHAAAPFAASLLDAIAQIQAGEEDQDFIPVITRDSAD